jgi:pyroglutamyl-peptidase
LLSEQVHDLRKLPVDFQLAPKKVIACMQQLQPNLVICCGMAEQRSRLSVESNGKHEEEVLHTKVDLHPLIEDLPFTEISHNAGRFVCNYTYYSVLKHIQDHQLSTKCLFVHVPVLTQANLEPAIQDFSVLLERLIRIPVRDRKQG